MSEGIAISANYFAKCASVASSTGGTILHEISDVVVKNMDSAANVLTAKFRQIIGKRSKETPARERPFAEPAEEEKRAAERAKRKGITPAPRPEVTELPAQLEPCGELEKEIYKLIMDEPVHDVERYAARYWCFLDSEVWTFSSLMKACAKAKRPSYAQLTSYVSPLAVKLAFPEPPQQQQ